MGFRVLSKLGRELAPSLREVGEVERVGAMAKASRISGGENLPHIRSLLDPKSAGFVGLGSPPEAKGVAGTHQYSQCTMLGGHFTSVRR